MLVSARISPTILCGSRLTKKAAQKLLMQLLRRNEREHEHLLNLLNQTKPGPLAARPRPRVDLRLMSAPIISGICSGIAHCF